MRKLSLFAAGAMGLVAGLLGAYEVAHSPAYVYSTPLPSPAAESPLVPSDTSNISTSTEISASTTRVLFTYAEVIGSCGPYYQGICVNLRSNPSTSSPAVMKLRNGMVFKVKGSTTVNGMRWYQLSPDTSVRYPERITTDWYVYEGGVRIFTDDGDHRLSGAIKTKTKKRIIVDRSEQMLYAFEGDTLFMKQSVSTGLELTPTPRGTFTVYAMTPSRYMQGPLPDVSDQYYDLPGVPWNLYFTKEGAVIHGAYWHDKFGKNWSHGCVNLPPQKAKELYEWAELGVSVTVRD